MFGDEGAEEVEEVGLHGEEVWGAGPLVLGVAVLVFSGGWSLGCYLVVVSVPIGRFSMGGGAEGRKRGFRFGMGCSRTCW